MARDPWHQESVKKVVEKLHSNFDVKAPFNLPKQNRAKSLYQPDVVAFEKGTDEIKLIIELESSNVRKSIMGAAILAQICVKEKNQNSKPKLIFVLKNKSDQEEIRKLNVRLEKMTEILKESYLDPPIDMDSLEEFLRRTF